VGEKEEPKHGPIEGMCRGKMLWKKKVGSKASLKIRKCWGELKKKERVPPKRRRFTKNGGKRKVGVWVRQKSSKGRTSSKQQQKPRKRGGIQGHANWLRKRRQTRTFQPGMFVKRILVLPNEGVGCVERDMFQTLKRVGNWKNRPAK